MAWSWASSLSPSPESPAAARLFVENALGEAYGEVRGPLAGICDDLVVIVSELVTNAVQAASGPVRLELLIDRGAVRLAVADSAAGLPTPATAPVTQPSGRGLAIVAALSHDWGVVPRDGGSGVGKTVWASLRLPVMPPRSS